MRETTAQHNSLAENADSADVPYIQITTPYVCIISPHAKNLRHLRYLREILHNPIHALTHRTQADIWNPYC